MRRVVSLALIAACLGSLWYLRPAKLPFEGEDAPPAAATSSAGVVVFDLRDGASEAEITAFEQRYGVDVAYSSDVSADEGLVRATTADPAALIAAAAGDPLVELAEPEVLFEAFGAPNDPMWEKQWNMRMIDAPAAWDVGAGRGVRVAVIDTGVSAVEDLPTAQIAPGKSFVPGTKSADDDHGHGTHVSGTIAQATNNGLGVTGVAPEVTIVPYKVLNRQGFGASDAIAAAVDEAVDQGADVINMSLGGPHSSVLHKAVNEAAARGVIVVASAGNTGRRGVGCPGHAERVIGVSAVGPDDLLAPYSSYGPGVEIAAPGGNTQLADGGILQDTVDGKGGHSYRAFQGTSMASPHVAGAAAVLLGMGMDDEAAIEAMMRSTTDRGDSGFDERYGHGRLNLGAAVSGAGGQLPGARAGAGAALGLALATLVGLRFASALRVGLWAAVVAGGLFFLPWLPIPSNAVVQLLNRPLVAWPGSVIGVDWTHFPIWLSVVFPAIIGFILGPSRLLGRFAMGLAAGFGLSLLDGAWTRSLDPWWMGELPGRVWLYVNGGASLLVAGLVGGMVAAQTEKK